MAEIQRADDHCRRFTIVVLIMVLIGGVAIWAVFEEWMIEVRSLPAEAARQSLSMVFWLCVGVMGVCVWIAGWYCWRVGGRVRHAMRFPPPNTSVIRDTIVLTGQAAVSRGRLLQVFGVILILCTIGLAVMSWFMLRMIQGAHG